EGETSVDCGEIVPKYEVSYKRTYSPSAESPTLTFRLYEGCISANHHDLIFRVVHTAAPPTEYPPQFLSLSTVTLARCVVPDRRVPCTGQKCGDPFSGLPYKATAFCLPRESVNTLRPHD
ncbi:hypothetical protein L9F63_012296, partial [Diploptera punctata]